MRRTVRQLLMFPRATVSAYSDAAYNAQAAVTVGDLVLLWFIGAGAATPAAPTGWTRVLNTSDANGYAVALYTSTYSLSNAAADTTNFPPNNGYFFTVVYAGAHTVPQVGVFSDSSGGAAGVTLAALAAATAPSSTLIAFVNSRDPDILTITSSNNMARKVFSAAPTYFDFAFFEQPGAQIGPRDFARTHGLTLLYNFNGVLVEVA